MQRAEQQSLFPRTNTHEQRFLRPWEGWKEDYERIYNRGKYSVGSPELAESLLFQYILEQPRTIIFGGQLGDEGKGRFVDNEIDSMLQLPRVKQVLVVRYQGGNNAGHTIERGGKRIALHVIPSGIFYTEAVGIMDRGMVINVGDLQTEVADAESKVGDLRGRLYLSDAAIHNTDLERALEYGNVAQTKKADGGTMRGMGPSYAGHYDRTGKKIHEFLSADWRESYGKRYDDISNELTAKGIPLETVVVPDFEATIRSGPAQTRKVGTKAEFLDRLEESREWLLQRDMVRDTITIHEQTIANTKQGVLFEGSQAVGLDAWLGTYPDVTSSNTTASGIKEGTAFWKKDQCGKRMAVIKHNPSSVGKRRMPTHIDLPRTWDEPLPEDATPDQIYADWVRRKAREVGTTTGRFRDMNALDLAFLAHTLHLGEANSLGVTHLDVARESDSIPVATHYVRKDDGKTPIRFRPDLRLLDEVQPHKIYLPGWNGDECAKATAFDDLPENAKKYLAFIQTRTGLPVIAVTTGPDEKNYIEFKGSHCSS